MLLFSLETLNQIELDLCVVEQVPQATQRLKSNFKITYFDRSGHRIGNVF